MRFFPGLKCKFIVHTSDSWELLTLPESRLSFYEQYSGMTREQADFQILEDTKWIIRQYIPEAEFVGYERNNEYILFTEPGAARMSRMNNPKSVGENEET